MPTKRARLVEYVVRAIEQGQYQPGQSLPSEAELGRAHGYSRITVRAALLELAYGGRVEPRHGRGWYVRAAPLPATCCDRTLATGDDTADFPGFSPPGTVAVNTTREVSMMSKPVYMQIAENLRDEIRSGQREPGSKLPSEADLATRYEVSRITVRRALALLTSWALTTTTRGSGTYVRSVAPVIRVGAGRFRAEDRARGKGAFAAEAERLGLSWRQEDLELALIELPAPIAEVLGEPKGVVKRRLMSLADEPAQLADSYVPESIATRMGYEQGANAPGGLYSLLAQHGHEVAEFTEEIQARVATPEEAEMLALPHGSAVAALTRVAYDGQGRAVEVFEGVMVGDMYRFSYRFPA